MTSKQEIICRAIRRHAPDAGRPLRILDIGFAQEPNRHLKGEVYGIDIFEREKPENYAEVRRVDLNAEPIPFPDGFFDVVIAGCTLAHLANPLAFVCDVNRVLAPGGLFVPTSPNPNYYWENAMNVFFRFFSKRVSKIKFEEHFYSFTRYNIRTIAKRCGMEVIDELGCLFALVKLGWRFDVIRYPGLAYEIVYVLKKTGEPTRYATYEDPEKGVIRLPTTYGG